MPQLFGLPVHPAAAHFPVAATAFGAVALAVAAWLTARGKSDESAPWRIAGLLLLTVALLGAPVMIWSGRAWAISMDDMAAGSLLPKRDAEEGILYNHALSAGATALAVLAASVLAYTSRDPKKPVLLAALVAILAAALMSFTGHLGGTMVHKPAGAPAEPPGK
jgi:heme A synthase